MRKPRMYGLFEVTRLPDGRKKYTRLYETLAYPKETAVRLFQGRLLAPFMGEDAPICELRPVKQ